MNLNLKKADFKTVTNFLPDNRQLNSSNLFHEIVSSANDLPTECKKRCQKMMRKIDCQTNKRMRWSHQMIQIDTATRSFPEDLLSLTWRNKNWMRLYQPSWTCFSNNNNRLVCFGFKPSTMLVSNKSRVIRECFTKERFQKYLQKNGNTLNCEF